MFDAGSKYDNVNLNLNKFWQSSTNLTSCLHWYNGHPFGVTVTNKFSTTSTIGGGTIFRVGGGQTFGSKKGRVSAGCRACAKQGGVWGMCSPQKLGFFFEIVGLSEAIWCTIFHNVNIYRGVCFTLEQDGQKSEGAMPPSLKSGGATGPPPPVSPPMTRTSF